MHSFLPSQNTFTEPNQGCRWEPFVPILGLGCKRNFGSSESAWARESRPCWWPLPFPISGPPGLLSVARVVLIPCSASPMPKPGGRLNMEKGRGTRRRTRNCLAKAVTFRTNLNAPRVVCIAWGESRRLHGAASGNIMSSFNGMGGRVCFSVGYYNNTPLQGTD